MLSVGRLREDIPKPAGDWGSRGAGPAVPGGGASVPVGVWLLKNLPGPRIVMVLGTLIVLYSGYSLFKPSGLKIHGFGGAASGLIVGALGGAIGGFTAFPGLPVVVWTGLRGLPKAPNRAIVQSFILTLQILSLITNGVQHPGNFGKPFWVVLAL